MKVGMERRSRIECKKRGAIQQCKGMGSRMEGKKEE
jgi:hypothetical protein